MTRITPSPARGSGALPPGRRALLALGALAAALLAAGCGGGSEPAAERLRFNALGTEIEINIAEAGGGDAAAAAQAAREEIEAIHEAWHPRYGAELAPLNERLAAGEGAEVSDGLVELLRQARAIERASGGRFNPAIGGLIELWGFSRHDGRLEAPPPREEVEAWLERAPSLADLRIEGNRVSSRNDAVQLDLGGIGKGYAAERAVEALRGAGVEAAVVNLGGDLATLGRPEAGARPWRIGVRHPRDRAILATVRAQADEAVFTSGDYERAFKHEDRRYHHILDPTTGYPAMGSRSVTVVHEDPVLADAAATALFIAGPEAAFTVAERLGVRRMLLIDRDGEAWQTEAMAERTTFEQPMGRIHTE